MARKQVLKVNRTISIIPADGPRFRSVIQDVQRSDFFILAPEERPKLAPGEEVAAMLIGPDACYHFLTEVLSYQAGPPPVYCLRYPAACQRLQNRKHVRALVALEVPYVLADGFGKGIMVDLSSGGGSWSCARNCPQARYLHCSYRCRVGKRWRLRRKCSVLSPVRSRGSTVGGGGGVSGPG